MYILAGCSDKAYISIHNLSTLSSVIGVLLFGRVVALGIPRQVALGIPRHVALGIPRHVALGIPRSCNLALPGRVLDLPISATFT